MDASEILTQEYNKLWAEKLVHKQGIRKFHNYLTYITAIGSLALAFHGLNAQDVISAVNNTQKAKEIMENASSILHLFFIPFAPVLLITLTFPLNDMFHIYAIGNHIGKIESRINLMENKKLLLWEHQVCPKVYGGDEDQKGNKISNIIMMGDALLLIPALFVLGVITTYISTSFIYHNLSTLWAVGYLALVTYMFGMVIGLALKLKNYTSPKGKLTVIIQNANDCSEINESKSVV
ncbi:hypothetical protein [Desulfobacterium sp. N47]|uniref:Uncharacterized protein n=1 Tax=uncultured Desulfobacterium sp. TaxID=201089 RepID=E1YBZ8_9BACT|nr:unknown protein [uncultured Desulfobacterium sp.]